MTTTQCYVVTVQYTCRPLNTVQKQSERLAPEGLRNISMYPSVRMLPVGLLDVLLPVGRPVATALLVRVLLKQPLKRSKQSRTEQNRTEGRSSFGYIFRINIQHASATRKTEEF